MKCFYLVVGVLILAGCQTNPSTPVIDSVPQEIERLSVASAQLINIGDSQTEVVKALGSPNIITKNSAGQASWVFDRLATYYEAIETTSNGGLRLLGSGSRSESISKSAITTKTLIIVIDFDDKSIVKDLIYRFSQY